MLSEGRSDKGMKMKVKKRAAVLSTICFLAVCFLAMVSMGCATGAPSTQDMGGSAGATAPASDAVEQIAHVTVEGPDGGDALVDADLTVEEGATALDALKAVDVDIVVEDSAFGPFVSSIAGIANEGSNGWTYAVNGEIPSVSAGEQVLAAGDTVVWSYYRA